MSLDIESTEQNNEVIEAIKENTRWLKVIATILGEMQDTDHDNTYEDIENG